MNPSLRWIAPTALLWALAALFLIPGFSLALTIPGKSPTAGKYVEKKDKKKEKTA